MNSTAAPYRIIALILALLMLSTSVSFALDVHYCGGQLKSVGFFTSAKACSGEMKTATGPSCRHTDGSIHTAQASLQQKKCCQNRTLHVESAQDRITQSNDLALSKPLQQFVAAFVQAFFNIHVDSAFQSVPFAQYRPPLIPRDIPVLIQSFLL